MRNTKISIMEIKVLGPGCPNCKTLEKNVLKAVSELEIEATVEKVDDMVKIMSYGILRTPGLVINDKLIFSGRVPSLNELKDFIQKNQ